MAALAVSCAKTGEVNSVSGPAIGFDTWTNNLTKSVHTPFATGATFDVYGYKHKNDGDVNTTVFDGDDVTLDANGSWNYTQIRSWDRTTDSYTFFAIAPTGIISANSSPSQTGLFVTNDITFGGKNGDILVAMKKVIAKTSYTLTVNSVSIQNIQTKGHLSVTGYDGTGKPETEWALAETPVTATFNNTHGNTSVTLPKSIAVGVEHGVNHSEFLIDNLIVMPQTLITTGQKLVINYTVNFSNESITHTREIALNAFDYTDMTGEGRDESDQNTSPFITTWDPGKHYTYYLTINADLIVFNATISDWNDVNAFHYIIN